MIDLESNLNLENLIMTSSNMFVDCPPREDVAPEPSGVDNKPDKTKSRTYELQYKRFHKWRKLKQATGTSEHIILDYITERSKLVSASTLWAEYSMIKSMIKVKENEDIGSYHNVQAFLSKNLKGYTPKRSYILTKDQCLTFLREAPDEKFLIMKSILIMGIYGACRRVELENLKLGDLSHYNDHILVTIAKRENFSARTFTITNNTMDNVNVVELIHKYLALRPSHSPQERLFVHYNLSRGIVMAVGKNALSKIPTKIATYLNLDNPDSYTGHCFRRSSASLLANTGADLNRVRKRGCPSDPDVPDDSIEKRRIGTTGTSHPLNTDDERETFSVNSTSEVIEFENTSTTCTSTSDDSDDSVEEKPNTSNYLSNCRTETSTNNSAELGLQNISLANVTLPRTARAITICNSPQGVINIYYRK